MRFVLLVVAMALGCKGDPVQCEKACRNYAELSYWDEAEKEITAAPTEQRDDLRKKKMAEFSEKMSRGIDMCTSKCMSANNDKDIKCLSEARTAKEAKACTTK
jgi:hypothetical protein